MRPFVGGCVSEWVSGFVSVSIALCLVGTIQTTLLARSLSNFTCKLWMMRGGTLLGLLGGYSQERRKNWSKHRFPGWHQREWSWVDTSRIEFLFWVTGSKVKVNFGTLYIRPCGQDTDFSVQSLSNFTCKLWMMRGGTLLILGHGVKGQGQLWHSMYKTLWAEYRLQF